MLTMNPTPPRTGGASGRLLGLARHRLGIPLLLAVMLLAAGASIAITFKVPSWGNDEPAHVGYVAALARGDLPTIDTPIVDDPARFPGTAVEFQGWDEAHGQIWTANHPPLYHALLVPVWEVAHENQTAMILTMRLINTVGFALWVLLVALVARELVPRRPAVAVLATVVALAPTLVMRSAFLINDGFGSSAALLAILMTIRIMREGITPRRLALVALAGSIAAGTRAPGVLVVAVCTFAVLLPVVRRDGWLRGLGVAAVVGGIPALATGWFYLRNVTLYGDLTGQDALLEKFQRPTVNLLENWYHIRGTQEVTLSTPIPFLTLLVLGPVVLFLAVRARRIRIDGAWGLTVALTVLTGYNVLTFLAAGGGFHDRYLMQVMPLIATVTALVMLEVGRWLPGAARDLERRDWIAATAWSTVLLLWLAGTLAVLVHFYIYRRQTSLVVDGPLPDLLVAVAVVAGFAAVAAMVVRVRDTASPPHAVPERAVEPPLDPVPAARVD